MNQTIALLLTAGALGAAGCASAPPTAQTIDPAPRVVMEDFAVLFGASYAGALTYRDYGTGKPVSIPANATVSATGPDALEVAFSYPEEPGANAISRVAISENGRRLGDDAVITRDMVDGGWLATTEAAGEDNGAPAQLFKTYAVSRCFFIMTTRVAPAAGGETFERNRYDLKRADRACDDAASPF